MPIATGATQIYLADANGTNLRKVTNLHAGAQAPFVWSPDGTRIAFVSDVHPECADEACNRKEAEAAAANPVKVRRLTRLLYRHWDEWRENIRHHVFVTTLANGATRDLTPGDYDSPPTQQEGGALAFSPDSKTVAFVSNREGNDKEAWTTNNDVFLVPVDEGEPRLLTRNPAADTHPVFSRDGRTLYTLSQRRPGVESERWYLDRSTSRLARVARCSPRRTSQSASSSSCSRCPRSWRRWTCFAPEPTEAG